jgi:hypothetical protein
MGLGTAISQKIEKNDQVPEGLKSMVGIPTQKHASSG